MLLVPDLNNIKNNRDLNDRNGQEGNIARSALMDDYEVRRKAHQAKIPSLNAVKLDASNPFAQFVK